MGVCYAMVSDLDADGSGEIEFGEFLDVMTQRMNESTSREDIQRVFNLFDKDRNGPLEVDDLRRSAKDCGVELNEVDAREIIQRGDLDGDGVVNATPHLAKKVDSSSSSSDVNETPCSG